MTDLPIIPAPPLPPASPPLAGVRAILEGWWSGLRPNTRRIYALALDQFAAHLGRERIEALAWLFGQPPAEAIAAVEAWAAAMQARGLAPKTRRLQLAALQSLARRVNALGVVAWNLSMVRRPENVTVRQVHGASDAEFVALLNYMRRHRTHIQARYRRDLAALALLNNLALRARDVVALRVADLELDAGHVVAVMATRKRSDVRHRHAVDPATGAVLDYYLAERGRSPGSLLGWRSPVCLSIHFRRLSRAAGVRALTPHTFRHRSITLANRLLDLAHAAELAGHADVRTTRDCYLDDRARMQAEAAAGVGAAAAALGLRPDDPAE